MRSGQKFFFCGIGGSGMLPLAMILKSRGFSISGSDRSYDQGRTPEKFQYLSSQGIELSPQDGGGLRNDMVLVVSTAIENSIPEVKRAKDENIPILKRSELLAEVFNAAENRIAIAGTSGKSTTTGMLGYVLSEMGRDPTVMNGAIFKNFVTEDHPYATAICGGEKIFITEADESDGSIAFYRPTIAVLNNLSLDHKSMEELRLLFADFIAQAPVAVLNFDNEEVRALARSYNGRILSYSLTGEAGLQARNIIQKPHGIECSIEHDKEIFSLKLSLPGLHNLSNALAALSCLIALGEELEKSCRILSGFSGVKRRMEIVGEKAGITVIDDFAHNPDKIEASLKTLKQFPGRLLIIFQMHGFAPLQLMKAELADAFSHYLDKDDEIFMPEVLYLGGSTDKSYTAKDFVSSLENRGLQAHWFEKRDLIPAALLQKVKSGDRIVVMGARDDTLSSFARDILQSISA